jgi:GntR family transcriptional regulator, transcriptional repressor for pyruvate dehydrogenase complex
MRRHNGRVVTSAPRRKLSEDITAVLSGQIADGTVAPHAHLPAEADLAQHFGVSARVVREALQHLAGKGLIELRQGRRARVRPANSGMLSEALSLALSRSNGSGAHLLEVRRPLETEIARLAAERATESELTAMERQLREMDRLGPLLDSSPNEAEPLVREFIVYDLEFHRLLGVASHNPVMLQLIDALAGLLRETRVRTTWSVVRLGPGIGPNRADHWGIFEAVRRRDSARAAEPMRRHLDRVQRDLGVAEADEARASASRA